MKPHILHPGARQEVDEAMAYYEKQRRGLGLELEEEVFAAIRKVQENPFLGALYRKTDARFQLVHRFPYVIYYEDWEDSIFVYAIAHASRRPGFAQAQAALRSFSMTSDEILLDAEERMEKAGTVLRDELRSIRTGRASPALVDTLRVEYYGSPTPLRQLAAISTPDPQQILIRPFDPGSVKDIEKAIQASDVGLTPNSDGKIIRLAVPAMSGEQRQKMVARVKKLAEETKVAIRNVRRDANKRFDAEEKAKTLTEDERDSGKEEVQSLTDKYEAKAQEFGDKKAAEIME